MVEQPVPIAVIGAGSIGVGWATVFARVQQPVVVFDLDSARLESAEAELKMVLAQLFDMNLLDDVVSSTRMVTFDSNLESAVRGAHHVQECIPESLPMKQALFAELDGLAGPNTTLASSSSAITCSSFANTLRGRDRCLVAHPANPPYLLPVVEVVPAPFTSDQAVGQVSALMESAGMSVINVHREIEGFVYNRLQGALLREAYCLVRDGVVEPEDIDKIVHDGLGRRWSVLGPFETAELNTRGGIEAHALKIGPAYQRMGEERGQHDPWTPDLVSRVAESVHRRFPPEEWAQSVSWRDRALMTLQRARNESPSVFEREAIDSAPKDVGKG